MTPCRNDEKTFSNVYVEIDEIRLTFFSDKVVPLNVDIFQFRRNKSE